MRIEANSNCENFKNGQKWLGWSNKTKLCKQDEGRVWSVKCGVGWVDWRRRSLSRFLEKAVNLELRGKLLLVFHMVSTVIKYKMLWCMWVSWHITWSSWLYLAMLKAALARRGSAGCTVSHTCKSEHTSIQRHMCLCLWTWEKPSALPCIVIEVKSRGNLMDRIATWCGQSSENEFKEHILSTCGSLNFSSGLPPRTFSPMKPSRLFLSSHSPNLYLM